MFLLVDVPKRANFEDTLRKLKNQLSEAEKKITAGKKLADAQKTLLDAVLSTPGKIVGELGKTHKKRSPPPP